MPWRQDFFVGWAGHLPTAQAAAIRAVVASAVTIFLLLGLALARSGPDPGGGDGIGDEVTLRGVLTARPYPTLTLPPAPGATVGRTIMLAGGGKTAPPFDPALDGQPVAATGYMLRRGVLDMLQVGDPLQPGTTASPPPRVEPLGIWRITGEICDGKCYAGAMRPGAGIAHRACANLCVTGGEAAWNAAAICWSSSPTSAAPWCVDGSPCVRQGQGFALDPPGAKPLDLKYMIINGFPKAAGLWRVQGRALALPCYSRP